MFWSDTFSDRPELREVDRVIKELRSKGVQFPDPASTYESLQTYSNYSNQEANSAASAAATNSAATSAAAPVSPRPRLPQAQRPTSMTGRPQQQQQQRQQPPPQPVGQLTPHQLGKLKSDVDQVCTNCRIFNELLTEAANGTAQPEDLQLMRQLNSVNRKMQQRVMELLGQVSSESVLSELLRVNDELNSAFLRFDRFENSRPPPRGTVDSLATRQQLQEPLSAATVGVNLIDLSEDDPPPPPPPRPAAAEPVSNPGNLPDSEAELREMESWMRSEGLADAEGDSSQQSRVGDKFQL
ncbi:hypothetical protein BOX15_Mlig004254g1 [Macrostomum lignano]|nr:hypothetical protein BOX15_Mlig004254g1 [Macrostomum lignano]